MSRLRAWQDRVRTGFWAVPALCVTLAVGLALGLVAIDRRLEGSVRFAFGAGPDGAREVLSAISTSMITFTGLVFSITIVVLQLTSSQFSPRVLRTFLRDRQTQLSLGTFVATFVYAVTVLRTVTGLEEDTFVPAVATTAGLVLLLVSVAVFVAYIHHVATAIQVSSIIAAIGDETRTTIARTAPTGTRPGHHHAWPRQPATAVLPATRSGVLVTLDHASLVTLARDADVVLRLDRRMGEFIAEGAPLVEVLGPADGLDERAVLRAVTQGRDRTMQQDVGFGLRQLVDIAERALSPGVNDPTTAVQALDELHDLLRRLATRTLPDGLHADADGTLRLAARPDSLEDHLDLALSEIEQYGETSVQVQRKLLALRADLASACPG